MTATFDTVRDQVIAKLIDSYQTGSNDRFIDVDALTSVLFQVGDEKTGEPLAANFANLSDQTFWGLAVRYPAHQAPDWFDPSWIPEYDDES